MPPVELAMPLTPNDRVPHRALRLRRWRFEGPGDEFDPEYRNFVLTDTRPDILVLYIIQSLFAGVIERYYDEDERYDHQSNVVDEWIDMAWRMPFALASGQEDCREMLGLCEFQRTALGNPQRNFKRPRK